VSKPSKLLIIVSLVLLTAGPAYPQEKLLLQLQSDVLKLQQTVNQLQISLDQKTQSIQGLVEKMADQVNGLNGNIQKINQTVETVNTHGDRSAAELRALMTTMSTRVMELAEGFSAVRSQLSNVSQQITAMKTTTETLPGADEVWRAAFVDFSAGNYDLAIQEYSDFQAKFPGDPRTPEAQIRKGEALSAQGKFDQAVIEYDLFLQKYPESSNTKTALLKKGLAQAEMKDVPKATQTLQLVVKQYPNTVEATAATAKLKELSTGARGRRGP
jgi:tol-pal system protein YbgF